ncbi:SOS response-associated peptidase family protein [Variovorax sp. ZS18.2.2]|uniref:SOS response-associated peptidase family protein n=1 Tax=Variovorax sp. ZS18.2.2 TaxID=2971255 RepID=UPI0021516421|nr:SOS response-associated peptidase family protein [Variovorax sp. ZS18.2.2]MCR6481055.1 SOS response-associated peptidase family protein [Variovorax sp. ZS18.2.2]
MCYSQQVSQDFNRLMRTFGAKLSTKEFLALYQRRQRGERVLVPKGMDEAFLASSDPSLGEIRDLIREHLASESTRLEELLFAQRTRLVDAERKLEVKFTKGATESKRIAGDKIEDAKIKLADLRRREPKLRDSRIYPSSYAMVMVVEEGERKIMPMRYLCRPAGKPASYDERYPGTYNARRNSLNGYWKGLWGQSHGLILSTAFFEHVKQHRKEGRELEAGEKEVDMVLEFRPQPEQEMFVACLWSRWTAPGEPDLLSFAAITDEPPAEVAAAGHDRCIIPIDPANVDAWVNPDPRHLEEQEAILDERERPYYEHRLAA